MKITDLKITRWFGAGISLMGVIILCVYFISTTYNLNIEGRNIWVNTRIGMTWMILGAVIVILDLCVERYIVSLKG